MIQPNSSNPGFFITFLRHGESLANANGFRQGQADFPLTELGREQSRILAVRWQTEGVTFDKIISSSLSRARETGDIINAHLNLPTEIDPVWMERDIGVLAGLSEQEASELYPRPQYVPLYQPIGERGESQWQLFLRAGQAVNDLIRKKEGRYLVITHGGLLNMVLHVILGLTPQANFQGAYFRIPNTGYVNLSYNPVNRRWRVIQLNANEERNNNKWAANQYPHSDDYQITFLRHGESLDNAKGRLQGQANSPLSDIGIEQVKSLADYWQNHNPGFDRVISSPLERARRTANIIARSLDFLVELDETWMEQDFGLFTGLRLEEIPNYPNSTILHEPYTPIGERGESRWEAYVRAGHALQGLVSRPPGNYLIVAHGGILNLVMCAILGITPQTNVPSPGFRFDNTGFAKLLYRPQSHNWHVLSINNRPHL